MAIKKNKNNCCGCTACASICHNGAIEMQPDVMGFLYPVVHYDKCVECGLCEEVCQFKKEYDLVDHYDTPLTYAVRHKDIREVETSRSGASFIAITDWIIENGGVVYGAAIGKDLKVAHCRATSRIERDSFKGSKYVQSDMTLIFQSVKNDLQDGRIVLFSGTSCQVAGLKSYVGKKYNKLLYTIDIICYGVPSPKLWKDYVGYVERRIKKHILSVDFRNKKDFGWYDQMESFFFSDGTQLNTNTYALLFQNNYLRHSCFYCPYTNLNRVGDITLGDYWGWERTDKTFNADGKGCSLLLVNSPHGKEIFENIEESIIFIPTSIEKISQPRLERPTEKPVTINDFEKDYIKYGFVYVARKYSNLMEVFNDIPFFLKVRRKLYFYILKAKNILK